MSYTALYRKFRPRTFKEVRGQEAVVTTLKNQIINQRISHAYLFCGTRGTGKTTIAKIFSRAVNCENPKDGSPCGECESCRSILNGSSMNVIEIDAASNNGVDDVRQIIEEVAYSPAQGRYKVYIVDEVHMMSPGAFNALLKTLEEPPEYVIFILATTEANKLPVTILSRCQRYDFRRISMEEICGRIRELCDKEQVAIEDKAVRFIARSSDGAMRDALSLLDQCISFYLGQELTYEKVLDVLGAVDVEVFSRMFRLLTSGDVTGSIRLLDEIIMQGRDPMQFITDFTGYLRNLLLLNSSEDADEVIDVSAENLKRMKEEAAMTEQEVLMRYIRILSELQGQLRYATQKRILLEVALVKLCKPETERDYGSLVDRISKLEKMLENGIPVMQSAGPLPGVRDMGSADAAPDKPRTELKKPLPEEMKEIAGAWGRILSELTGPDASCLANAYPSIENDDTLTVIVREPYAADRYEKPENLDKLKDAIAKVTDRDVRVVVRCEGDVGDLEYPDIRQSVDAQIDMEIEETEDGDDDLI